MRPIVCAAALAAAFLGSAPAFGQDTADSGADPAWWPEYTEFFGEFALEATLFPETPQFPGQANHAGSVAGEATLLAEWLDGDLAVEVTPFARFDFADQERSNFDVRTAKVDYAFGDWALRLGADRIFWGRAEAFHLVDIVNQTDAAEDLDDEDRLGQPMIRLARLTDIGEFSAIYFPYNRTRRFPGADGRLRTEPRVDDDAPIFEPSANRFAPSFALRYSGFVGPVDLGISMFHGLARDPSFTFDPTTGRLRPVYSRITQGAVDFQYTSGATLWKFEGLVRAGERDVTFDKSFFGAATGGLEHTLFGLFGSNADLGLILEYAVDSRFDDANTIFQNDLILGTRLALNDVDDTSVLLTGTGDLEDGSLAFRAEAERRLGERVKLSLEAQIFDLRSTGIAASLADDSFVRLKLGVFF
ncbi:MAG: hypothetical protein AAF577_02955 [Pseudomonadota bacterium]